MITILNEFVADLLDDFRRADDDALFLLLAIKDIIGRKDTRSYRIFAINSYEEGYFTSAIG